jgi:hypothetical protein
MSKQKIAEELFKEAPLRPRDRRLVRALVSSIQAESARPGGDDGRARPGRAISAGPRLRRMDVDLRCLDGFAAEPEGDQCLAYPLLQQLHRRAVPEDVRADALIVTICQSPARSDAAGRDVDLNVRYDVARAVLARALHHTKRSAAASEGRRVELLVEEATRRRHPLGLDCGRSQVHSSSRISASASPAPEVEATTRTWPLGGAVCGQHLTDTLFFFRNDEQGGRRHCST